MKRLRTAICLSVVLSGLGVHPGVSATGPLAGTFMYIGPPGLPEAITLAQIGPYLDELKYELQMDTIVLVASQSNVTPDSEPPGYACAHPSFRWAQGLDPALPDSQSKLLALAQGARDRQMDLYIGLVSSGTCIWGWWETSNRDNINSQMGVVLPAIKNKLDRPWLGASNPYLAVKGWYIPDEPAQCANFAYYYTPLVQTIRTHSPVSEGRRIVVSPYLVGAAPTLTPATFATDCGTLRSASGIDVLALQDSAGQGAVDPGQYGHLYTIESWFSALRDQIGINNLWADNELFTHANPLLDTCPGGSLTSRATSFTRLNAQLWQTRTAPAPAPVTSKRIAWLQQNHMGTSVNPSSESRRLKAQYRIYLGQGVLHPISSYTITPPPLSNFPDSNGTELLDGITGDPSNPGHSGWTGVGGNVTVSANLGSPKIVDWVAVELLQYPNWAIYFPATLTLLCSPDDFSPLVTIGSYNLPVTPPGCPSNREYIFANSTKLQQTCKWVGIQLATTPGYATFLGEIEISQEL